MDNTFITERRKKRFADVLALRNQDVIVLENIHDPHNALAAMRNCDAFGIQTAHFIFETETMFDPKKLGNATSSSANKWVDTVCWSRSEECLLSLKSDGFKLVATVIDPNAKKLPEFNIPEEKVAVIFGNEGYGVSETVKKSADTLVYIPMRGFVDSVNLSVSVGIMLYELSVARDKNKTMRLLSSDQRNIKDRWVKNEMRKKYRYNKTEI